MNAMVIGPETARMQAAALNARICLEAPAVQSSLANAVIAFVANPRANSDALLILADALREAAVQLTLIGRDDQAGCARTIAGALIEIAPSRAA